MELKYKTREFDLLREGESFALRNHGAEDFGRYDFLKDIQRLEQLRKLPNARAGFAVLLTNNPSYWEPPVPAEEDPSRHANDAAFRLHEGRTISGKVDWSKRAGLGTTKHRPPICLNGSYDLHWRNYADMGDGHKNRTIPLPRGPCASRIPNSLAESRIEATLRGVWPPPTRYAATRR